MDSHLIGSDIVLAVKTEKVYFSIKSDASHTFRYDPKNQNDSSILKITFSGQLDIELPFNQVIKRGEYPPNSSNIEIPTQPLFFEQQNYLLLIEGIGDNEITFWHDNQNVRNRITKTGKSYNILSGIINFGNDIGFSDLVVQLNGKDYLKITIEVFPSKITYKEDYEDILSDVTSEIYSVAFDFLKKTYKAYIQDDTRVSSPVEFLAIINRIFTQYLKSVDAIISRPHHKLEASYPIIRADKIKHTDRRTIRWIQNHPGSLSRNNLHTLPEKAPSVVKQVSYDTTENRLVKYILQLTQRKLVDFKKNYLLMERNTDLQHVNRINSMIDQLNQRLNSSFLSEVSDYKSSVGLSLVMTMALGYRELYKYHIMLLHGLSITGDIFKMSLKDLSVLYEYWCFIKINSIIKQKNQLVSQDLVKLRNNGLFISLVKGTGSEIIYRSFIGEKITLSYNPKIGNIPTITQQPDNVLCLEKIGSDYSYEYIFDAKYRINPAIVDSDYYKYISTTPGPEVDDINTMHRYRDAIVYQSQATTFQRLMFGAYVLFPYHDEETYSKHRFYTSIEKVNIGGLPFLPSTTSLVTSLIDKLISETADNANHRAVKQIGSE